jgi:hypothetical protein
LSFHSSFLAPGSYEVTLRERGRKGALVPVARYSFRITGAS